MIEDMSRRRWITIFIVSFIPLAFWMLAWFFYFAMSGGFRHGSLEIIFIILTVLYVGFQIWLAIHAIRE